MTAALPDCTALVEQIAAGRREVQMQGTSRRRGMEWTNLRETLLRQITANGDSRRFVKARVSDVVGNVLQEMAGEGLIELCRETPEALYYRVPPSGRPAAR